MTTLDDPKLLFDMLELPEWAHLRKLRHFHFSLELLGRNFHDLQTLVSHLTTLPTALELQAVQNRWRLFRALKEVAYRLHNYTASAQSLVDHSRVLVRDLFAEGALPQYQPEVDRRFVNDPLIQFVQNLRQMCQHFTLPDIIIQVRLAGPANDASFAARLVITKANLLQFSGWNARAKQFLDEASDEVLFWDVLQEYQTRVRDFYKWFLQQAEAHYAGDIDKLEAAQKEGLRRHWPTLLKSVEASLQRLEHQGEGSVQSSLYPLLSLSDQRALGQAQDDVPAWTRGAIERIQARGELPTTLVASIKRAGGLLE